jgi:RimJ/RimL family protein N-acetyltransferase
LSLFNPLKVVLADGSRCVLRAAEEADAKELVGYFNAVGGDSPYLDFGAGEFFYTAEDEGNYIRYARASANSLVLVAVVAEEVVATLTLQGQLPERLKHGAWLGITVARDFRGTGLARSLMEAGLRWAEANAVLRMLYLLTHPENARAVALFKKFGFEEQGRLKHMFRADGRFDDALCLAREVQGAGPALKL